MILIFNVIVVVIEEYFEEMKTYFIEKIEELKSTKPSWKMKLIVGVVLEYDRYNKEVETEIFIHSINEKKLC